MASCERAEIGGQGPIARQREDALARSKNACGHTYAWPRHDIVLKGLAPGGRQEQGESRMTLVPDARSVESIK